MAFADPQSITINAVAKSLVKILDDGLKSVYQTADGVWRFTISHQVSGGRTRRMVRVDQKVIASDPLNATSIYQSLGVYIVIDEPPFGFTGTEINYVVAGLKTWLDSTAVGKLLANEH